MIRDRIYLDYNATAPPSDPCKKAMIKTMDLFGNASSVHFEGRQARALIEEAREKISTSVGAAPENLFFTSGATEGASLLLNKGKTVCALVEHPCVKYWCKKTLKVSKSGEIKIVDLTQSSVQLANSETGILQDLPKGLYMSDIVQGVGKVKFSFKDSGIRSVIISAHKFGGPQGVGAVITEDNFVIEPQIFGGGQERGLRAGTESLTSIVGFGASIEFAKVQLDDGIWEKVRELRDLLEDELANGSRNTIFIGKEGKRLPNTSCFITPGWSGDMQVMQMDLAGFSISAGSACSSGTVSKNKVLAGMGFLPELADCCVRVSIGPQTTKEDILSFVKEWLRAQNDRAARVA